jgi:hypothetical protein
MLDYCNHLVLSLDGNECRDSASLNLNILLHFTMLYMSIIICNYLIPLWFL